MNSTQNVQAEFDSKESIIEESDSDDFVYPYHIESLKSEILSTINIPKKVEFVELYKIIVDTRKFEIDNYWKRILYFWSTITLILGGYFLIFEKGPKEYLIFISYLGFLYCLIFSFSLRGSKYWQEHWEKLAIEYEQIAGFSLFSWSLLKNIKKKYKKQTILFTPFRFSVSKLTFLISDITLIFWVLLVIKDSYYIINEKLLKFDFDIPNTKIDLLTIAVIAIPVLVISYIFILVRDNYSNYKKDINSKKKLINFKNLFPNH